MEYWYNALASDSGIKLRTSDLPGLQRRLYAARKEACDPDLDQLALVPSPTAPDVLWIVKRKP